MRFNRALVRVMFLGLFLSQTLLGTEEVGRGPVPDWVVAGAVESPAKAEVGKGSVNYLLVDLQRNLEKKEQYERFDIHIANEAGVEDFSQLDFDFQPEYETLRLHHIHVIRDGEVQDRLAGAEVEVIRREEGMDRLLYDGELTALVILKDMRPGDVLSYAFSLEGANPVFAGRVHSFYRLGFSSPVIKLHRRVLWDPKVRTLGWKIHVGAPDPVESEGSGGLRELRWEQTDTPRHDPEDDIPNWQIDSPWLEISDYGNWEAFGKWADEIYVPAAELPEELQAVCDGLKAEGLGREEMVIGVLRWVQGNIRYLGSFMGEHTHEPYPLDEVHRRRFGDCKDKGMMVVAMLRYLGFDADPAVVNTSRRRGVKRYLPGHSGFNHLIVHLDLDGERYWLDPTVTFQRGPLATVHTPDYGYAFVIREGEAALRVVEPRGYEVDWTELEERYVVPNMTGGAELFVHTVATGGDANRLRSELANDSREEVEETYREFYANDFPDLEVATPLSYTDDEDENRIEVREHYRIREFWEKDEDSEHEIAYDATIYARFLDTSLSYPEKETRSQPLAVGHPKRIRQTVRVELPEEWESEEETVDIEHPAFAFKSEMTVKGSVFEMVVEYRSLDDAVLPEDMKAYRKKMDELSNETYHTINHWDNPSQIAAAGTGEGERTDVTYLWVAVLGGLLIGGVLALGMFFFNPAARRPARWDYVGMGGWMVLVVIGVILSPLVLLGEGVTYFEGAMGLDAGHEEEVIFSWKRYFFIGTFMDAFFIPVLIMLVVLMFCRRTSFPWVFVATALLLLMSDLGVYFLEKELEFAVGDPAEERMTVLVQGFVRLFVWGAYMIRSQRVMATFVRRRGPQVVPQPPPLPGSQS